ncbi:hypothetical protein QBC41DRAFT_16546 [Cercophora samala]|uniref:Uncharacterized protein n=1 Tax=Cercophora samala TaxID=330535 RepID=A0AA39Z7Y3_9PEZI|nr:hypothetical protein QBC41DRAFT_16546 [Cercophora samala]
MSSVIQQEQVPEPQPAATESSQAIPTKRMTDDDEVEFISSSPVKRPRLNDQKPDPAVSQLQSHNSRTQPLKSPASQHHASGPSLPPNSTTSVANGRSDQLKSIEAPSQNPGHVVNLEHRGTLLPVLERFAFPMDSSPITCPLRMSVAISPKQLSETMPSSTHPDSLFTSPSVFPDCARPTGLEQVPCLDFNGIPVNGPTSEMGQMFLPSDNNALMSNSITIPSQIISQAAFGPNAIPFAMYSMGNIVPIPQQNMNMNTNPNPNTWMNPRPMQSQNSQASRQNDVPMPAKQQQQPQNMFTPSTPQAAPAPVYTHSPSHNQGPGKPPCLHCTVVRQEHIRRHQQTPPQPPQAQPQMPLPCTAQTFQPALPTPPEAAPSSQPDTTTPAPEQRPQHKQEFSIPLRKRPSPNLLIDIAETAEETFPYDEVAARHGVTPQKVFETLSSIVLIPLLRCPTDKRRSAKLAQDRVKHYSQLKSEMGKGKKEVARVREVSEFLGEDNVQQGKD